MPGRRPGTVPAVRVVLRGRARRCRRLHAPWRSRPCTTRGPAKVASGINNAWLQLIRSKVRTSRLITSVGFACSRHSAGAGQVDCPEGFQLACRDAAGPGSMAGRHRLACRAWGLAAAVIVLQRAAQARSATTATAVSAAATAISTICQPGMPPITTVRTRTGTCTSWWTCAAGSGGCLYQPGGKGCAGGCASCQARGGPGLARAAGAAAAKASRAPASLGQGQQRAAAEGGRRRGAGPARDALTKVIAARCP
jgi:hypothetical protein